MGPFNLYYRDYRLSSVLGHDLSTRHRVYEEHMAVGIARFFHVPSLLMYCERGDEAILEKINLPELKELGSTAREANDHSTSSARSRGKYLYLLIS